MEIMNEWPSAITRSVIEKANSKHSSPDTLRKYVVITLLTQVLLSLALLGVTIISDRIVNTVNAYADVATSRKVAFQSIGLTTNRFVAALAAEKLNTLYVARIQQGLREQTQELREISIFLDESVNDPSYYGFLRSKQAVLEFNRIEPQLNSLLERLEVLSTTSLLNLNYMHKQFDQVKLSVAPTGSIALGINSVTQILHNNAFEIEDILLSIRIAIVVTMIIIIISFGVFLILPALVKLAHARVREHSLLLRMESMACTDALTGLNNRQGLDILVENLSDYKTYALAIIDLNMFKSINDTSGHSTGDKVLLEVGRRLKNLCGTSRYSARIGGDEFAVLDTNASNKEDCEELGATLISIFDKSISYQQRNYMVGGSVGIALSSDIDGSFDDVAKSADAAMNTLKSDNKTGFDVYCKTRHTCVTDLNRKAEIIKALRDLSIQPWYQPKVDMRSGEILSFEALARWHISDQKKLLPIKFLADIDHYSLQFELTMSIFTQVLRQLREWRIYNYNVLPVSVNVSAEFLVSKESLKELRSLLNDFLDVKHLIKIEITEDVFLPRIANTLKKSMDLLAKDGVCFSLDDFGSGYSSLRHVNEFTFQEIKIDKSFVDGIGVDKSSETILKGLISIARGLNINLVAEGIETKQQADFLIDAGCATGQGFLYSKAVHSTQAYANIPSNDDQN